MPFSRLQMGFVLCFVFALKAFLVKSVFYYSFYTFYYQENLIFFLKEMFFVLPSATYRKDPSKGDVFIF